MLHNWVASDMASHLHLWTNWWYVLFVRENKQNVFINHNLFITLLLEFKAKTVLTKQWCIQTKMFTLYRNMTTNGHFSTESIHFCLDTTLWGTILKQSYIQNCLNITVLWWIDLYSSSSVFLRMDRNCQLECKYFSHQILTPDTFVGRYIPSGRYKGYE